MFKRALADEFDALVCLKTLCCQSGNEESVLKGSAKLTTHPSGLFTVAVCLMSSYSRNCDSNDARWILIFIKIIVRNFSSLSTKITFLVIILEVLTKNVLVKKIINHQSIKF